LKKNNNNDKQTNNNQNNNNNLGEDEQRKVGQMKTPDIKFEVPVCMFLSFFLFFFDN